MDSIEWGTWVMAFGTVGLVVVGAVAAWAAARTWTQAREDSAAQTRPYIWADLLPGVHGVQCFDLVIRNTGRTAAASLSITLPELPEVTSEDDATYRKTIQDGLAALTSLPPGAFRRMLWINGQDSAAGMPNQVDLRITYRGPEQLRGPKKGWAPWSKPGVVSDYDEVHALRVEPLYAGPMPTSGPNPHKDMTVTDRQMYGALGLIAQNIRMLNFDR